MIIKAATNAQTTNERPVRQTDMIEPTVSIASSCFLHRNAG
jgi:hypothetical protein